MGIFNMSKNNMWVRHTCKTKYATNKCKACLTKWSITRNVASQKCGCNKFLLKWSWTQPSLIWLSHCDQDTAHLTEQILGKLKDKVLRKLNSVYTKAIREEPESWWLVQCHNDPIVCACHWRSKCLPYKTHQVII